MAASDGSGSSRAKAPVGSTSWAPLVTVAVSVLLAAMPSEASYYYASSSSSSSEECQTNETQSSMFIGGGVCLGLAFVFVFVGCILGKKTKDCMALGAFLGFILGVVGVVLLALGAGTPICEALNVTATTASPSSVDDAPIEDRVAADPSHLLAALGLGGAGMLLMYAMFACMCANPKGKMTAQLAFLGALLSFCLYVGSMALFGVFGSAVDYGSDCEEVSFIMSASAFFVGMMISAVALAYILFSLDSSDKEKRKTCAVIFLVFCTSMFGCIGGVAFSCSPILANLTASRLDESTSADGIVGCVTPQSQLPRWCVGTDPNIDCSYSCSGVPEHLAALNDYDYAAYYLAVEDPATAGIVSCPQPDNFCGMWDDYESHLFTNISRIQGLNSRMCQSSSVAGGTVTFYLKYRVQYAGALSVPDHGEVMAGSAEGAAVPFWIKPLFAWKSLHYRVDGFGGETCAEQFRLGCVPLSDVAAGAGDSLLTDAVALESLNTYAEGVAYWELDRNSTGYTPGYNVHYTLGSARQACAKDCECIGIVMVTDNALFITGITLGIIVGIPALLCCCTITQIWPIPGCKRLCVELTSCVSRQDQEKSLDVALKSQQWISKAPVRMEKLPSAVVESWSTTFTLEHKGKSSSASSLEGAVGKDVAFFLNDPKLVPPTAKELENALLKCQQDVQLPLAANQSWNELDRRFQTACLYFAARRKRAIVALKDREVSRQLVAKFKFLSSSLQSSYDLMLNKKVYHDDFYLKTLKPLCSRMNTQAEILLSSPVEKQQKYAADRVTMNQKILNSPLRRGQDVVYNGVVAKVKSVEGDAVELAVPEATSTSKLLVRASSTQVTRILQRAYSFRDPNRYVAPHWTQDVRRDASVLHGSAPFSKILSEAMACARYFFPRTMVFLGQFSDLAGPYLQPGAMEQLIGYFENIADMNLMFSASAFDETSLPKPPAGEVEHVAIGAIKKAWRCAEKAMDRPNRQAGTPVFLTDIVRGQVLFKTIYALYAAVEALSRYEAVVVTRVKDRFANPANGGWADVLINFYHEADPNQHCCEVQFVLKDMMLLRGKDLGGHEDFNKFRSSFEVLESTNNAHLLDDTKCGPPCPFLFQACSKQHRREQRAKEAAKSGAHHSHNKIKPLASVLKDARQPVGKLQSTVIVVDDAYRRVANPVVPQQAREGAPTVPTPVVLAAVVENDAAPKKRSCFKSK